MAKKPEAEMTVLERIRETEQQLAQLKETAKAAALEKVMEGIGELREIGLHFVLNEAQPDTAKTEKKAAPDRKPKAGIKCPECGLITDPPHDRRHHKGHPGPFTAEEVSAKGWKIVN